MIPGVLFATWRIIEIVTLIPIVGMLSWFVNGFNKNNQLTPIFILVLFIVSVLALAWAFFTLILYHRARTSGRFIAFVDLLFVGALIAGVYELRGITNASCTHFSRSNNDIYLNLGPFGFLGVSNNNGLSVNVNKNCAMLKASFALAIMTIIFFFITFLISLWVGHHNRVEYAEPRRERVVYETRERHTSRSRRSSSPRHSHHSRRSSSRRQPIY
ncbi:Fatty acid transporter protein [Venturia nashicola]|uniref:Fatty acid transporter protein n=1 Tax=Venturia nashicola TaxID=86259 RepID=A0A4Z1P224_9PEZI|nr:Fatty acid transporter protein [Venturia nashicola]